MGKIFFNLVHAEAHTEPDGTVCPKEDKVDQLGSSKTD